MIKIVTNQHSIDIIVHYQDEERMGKLEDELKEARTQAEDADKKYDEVAKKLAQVIFVNVNLKNLLQTFEYKNLL